MRHQNLAVRQGKRVKIRRSGGFESLLWEFRVAEIEKVVRSNQRNRDIHRLYKEGFKNLRVGLEEFLQENNETLDEEYAFMKAYASAAIGSTDIVRTTSSFYSNECFSNVAVSVEGNRVVWYRKV